MSAAKTQNTRIASLDLLRGIVMIIMALDHTRDYFHKYSYYYDPADLSHTSPAIFFTRWITHFCAPVFVFLAGSSAFLIGQKKTKKELSLFLLKRGLWLMLLELTLVSFAWFFNPKFSLQALQVIWALGVCMVALSALIHLPWKILFALAIILVAGHNLLDNVHVAGNSFAAFAWSELHDFNMFHFGGLTVITAYPLIAWIGVMALGYCLGSLYKTGFPAEKRKLILLIAGSIGLFLFIILRSINVYGDPQKWTEQSSLVYSVFSFLNTTKYPPSLLFLLMTLSPALLFLSFAEKWRNPFTNILTTYGRVPLFYYLVHIYLLHLLAALAASLTGFRFTDMVITSNWITLEPSLKGYGFNLPIVYSIWIFIVIILYPLCRKYDNYKQSNREKWWLTYL